MELRRSIFLHDDGINSQSLLNTFLYDEMDTMGCYFNLEKMLVLVSALLELLNAMLVLVSALLVPC
jgi:hypothetical protein